jgi:phage-related protein
MADGSLDVVVKFIGDTKQLGNDISKVENSGSKLGSTMKGVAAGLAAGFAVHEVGDMVTAAEEADRASAKLAQTLGNAGDSTGEWAKHAEDLASSLQNQTGVDDEIIKGGQTILATFHKVSDGAAQTAGIFDRATTAAVDMSSAGFGSVESASTMLGKALNDPLKGITALGRAGVTFTDAQKDQIKALVKSGKTLDAQNLILKEVENQVGGTAKASVTASDKMAVAWGETQESIGKALLPVLEQITPILQGIASFVQKNSSWLVPLAGAIGAIVLAVKAWSAAQAILNIVLEANPIGLIVLAIAGLVAAIVVLVKNWDTVSAAAKAAWDTILGVVQGAFDWVKTNWPLLLGILTGPIGLAVVEIQRHWDSILGGIKDLVGTITRIFTDVGTAISEAFRTAFNAVAGFWNATVGSMEFSVPSWVPLLGGKGWSIPDMPTLAQGGLITSSGVVFAHAGEVIAPIEKVLPDRGSGAVMHIEHATFNEPVDVDVLSQRLEFALSSGLAV